MASNIKKGLSKKKRQEMISEIHGSITKKHQKEKKKILQKTSGAVPFDKECTPLDIQKKMRDDWK